jgi:hypothetical protein
MNPAPTSMLVKHCRDELHARPEKYKIPLIPPLVKGDFLPLFGKEGFGEIFLKTIEKVNSIKLV